MTHISEYGPELCRMFGINSMELSERAERGVESALFRRWIQGEWADTQPGEMDLSNRRESQLKEISQSIEDIGALKMFTAVAGSYLLENQTPPCIK